MTRIYLSPPEVGAEERRMLLDAFDSNWIAPVGPDIDAFERELAELVGVDHAVALSSGTAALHLALMLVGVGVGDEVLVPSFTFVASAAAVTMLVAPGPVTVRLADAAPAFATTSMTWAYCEAVAGSTRRRRAARKSAATTRSPFDQRASGRR